MGKVKMTIAQGLKELKLIDKKIGKKTERIRSLSAGIDNVVPEFKDASVQRAKVMELVQGVQDLIKRKMQIKKAILKANLETTVKYAGNEYSLQDIMLMKQGTKKSESGESLFRSLIQALSRDKEVEFEAERINRGEKDKDKHVGVVRYFDVDWRDGVDNWLFDFMQQADYLLEKANMSTFIDVEPLEEDGKTKIYPKESMLF